MSKKGKKKNTAAGLRSAVLKYFLKNPKKRMNAGQLLKKLKIKTNRDAIRSALEKLMAENMLRHIRDGKYVLNRKEAKARKSSSQGKQVHLGIVDATRTGAAYILVEGRDEDIYVSPRNINGAINGDEVEVTVVFNKGRRAEGRVTRIVQHNTTEVMGVLKKIKKKVYQLETASRKINLDIYISKEAINEAKEGDKILVKITHWGTAENRSLWGEVKKVYKGIDDHNWTMESILVENGFSSEYPEEVMREVSKYKEEISSEEIGRRRDFREVLTFTIDPDTAQDFDDAISYAELEDGNIEIGVHIADVTHFLKPNTALDKEAYERSTSVYLVDRCIAMLPEKLSNNLCSLKPNVDRLVFSAVFTFDGKHKMVNEWFGKGIIHSDKRFTYDEGQESLDNAEGLFHKELTIVNKVAHKLRKEKFKNGAVNFETDEVKFELDEKNKPIGVYVKQRKDIHMLIEDFMLLANKRVAKFIADKGKEKPIPFVYRIHDLPDAERVADLAEFMKDFGVELQMDTPENIAQSFNKLAKKARTDDMYKLLMLLAIRTMSKAVYSTNNIGHYGLRFEHYSHFTSPIRRYSDVLTHRILEKNLAKETYREDKNKLEAKCIHISKQERRAMEAERDSIKYKQVEYISEHIGEEYEGIISGMIERGVFVELSESKAEGLIPFVDFKEDFILHSRYKATSRGRKPKTIKMGDKIKVRVKSTDLEARQIELEIVE